MPKVFISYRRDEAAGYAGRIHERLAAILGTASVFMDVDDLLPGSEFALAIDKAVSSSDVLLVLIGKQWLNVANAQGNRRLDDPQDFVRREIAAGLRNNLRVIPVLLNNASLPPAVELPNDLKRLADHQAVEINEERWDYDVGRLVEALGGKPKHRYRQAAAAVAIGMLAVLLIAYYALRPGVDLNGKWTAEVPYEFSSPQQETFNFEHDGSVLRGMASFLRVDRLILDGKVEGNRIRFSLKTAEEAGDERRETMHYYQGTLEGNQITFVMQTDGGFTTHPPIRFVARRTGPM